MTLGKAAPIVDPYASALPKSVPSCEGSLSDHCSRDSARLSFTVPTVVSLRHFPVINLTDDGVHHDEVA